jgi:hypothetical protein
MKAPAKKPLHLQLLVGEHRGDLINSIGVSLAARPRGQTAPSPRLSGRNRPRRLPAPASAGVQKAE